MTYVINRGNVTFATRMINGKKGSESNTGFGVLASLETNTTIGDPPHDIKLKARIGWTPDPDDPDHYYRNGQCFHDYPGTNFDGSNVSGGCFRIEDPIGFYNEVKEAYEEGPVRVLSKP